MISKKYLISRVLRKMLNFPAINHSRLGKKARCDIGTVVSNSSLGDYSYIGEFTHLLYTDVGKFCSISNYCAIGGASHPMNWVSMSPAFNDSKGMMKTKLGKLHYEPFVRTKIGNDVWIGSHCLIKAGVTIGNGAIIGMGSVVTHDVGAYEMWVGNPAKVIGKRFDDSLISYLEEIQWWTWSNEKLKEFAHLFNDIEMLKNEVKNN